MDAHEYLSEFASRLSREFLEKRRILTFDEYLGLVFERPRLFLRNAAQYLLDAFEHYGRTSEGGFGLFELPFAEPKERLVGQEQVQREIYRLLRGFDEKGRADKVIALIGPNGSAKTSVVRCIMRALEHYSTLDQGALYRFNWVFPVSEVEEQRLGFARSEQVPSELRSFALLEERYVAARISCELKDPPILLIPPKERQALIERFKREHPQMREFAVSDYIKEGDLSPKNRAIFDALLSAYSGDYAKVLRHVQVERYFFSIRYKTGAVSVEPQMSVDASIRQVAADQRYANLPPVLRSIPMFEAFGRLIDANHGVLEFSDLLKRPIEAFKYLLSTCETGSINLEVAMLFLDIVFLASSNDEYLEAFEKMPEFPSFKGRMEFVRVPYLRNWRKEVQIYRNQLRFVSKRGAVAPHTVELAALWAVATRMRKPNPTKYPQEVRELVRRLTPIEKALLYADQLPDWVREQEKPILRQAVQTMQEEFEHRPDYEGRVGASPRVVKQVLLDAYDAAAGKPLTPVKLFDALEELIKQKSMYKFLQVEPEGDYLNHPRILRQLRDYWLNLVESEVRSSLELVEPERYDEFFGKYVQHVSAHLKGERIFNPHTRKHEEPSEALMRSLEERLGVSPQEARSFREAVMSRIAAYSLEHPGEEVNWRAVFDTEIRRLEQNYYERQKQTVAKGLKHALAILAEEKIDLTAEERERAEQMLRNLQERFDYPLDALPEVLDALYKARYKT